MKKYLLMLCCLGFIVYIANAATDKQQITGKCTLNQNSIKTMDYIGNIETNTNVLFSCACLDNSKSNSLLFLVPQQDFLFKNTYKETQTYTQYKLEQKEQVRQDFQRDNMNSIETYATCDQVCTKVCKEKAGKKIKQEAVTRDNKLMNGKCYIDTSRSVYKTMKADGRFSSHTEWTDGYVCGCFDNTKTDEPKFRLPIQYSQIGEKLPNNKCNIECSKLCNEKK